MNPQYGILDSGQVVVVSSDDGLGNTIELDPTVNVTLIDADQVAEKEQEFSDAERQRIDTILATLDDERAAKAPIEQSARNRLGSLGFTIEEVDLMLPSATAIGAVITFDDNGANIHLSGPTTGTFDVDFTVPSAFTNTVDFSAQSPVLITVIDAESIAFTVRDGDGNVVLTATGDKAE